jgi:hypothetical protein
MKADNPPLGDEKTFTGESPIRRGTRVELERFGGAPRLSPYQFWTLTRLKGNPFLATLDGVLNSRPAVSAIHLGI